ncbi:hypothetical protein Acr_27g0000210 [Actinidia rufa]|uniref:Retrotransposon gag domain-containing protein n=1 Tax=Actinidia rufa TaxID=165716 RepID=A0A7J0H5D8_9ERIC|nr:hypothetical protein Acr_27g0000210 [Actinidia rufa]
MVLAILSWEEDVDNNLQHPRGGLSGLAPTVYVCSLAQFDTVYGNNSSQFFMHLRSRLLPRPSASNPLDNRAPLMAINNQAPDLEGFYHEMHGIAEQIRIMKENNALAIAPIERNHLRTDAAVCQVYTPGEKRSLTRSESRLSSRTHDTKGEETMRRGMSPRRNAHIDTINTSTNAPITVDALIKQTKPLFTKRVMRTRVSSKFKLPTQLGVYEGKTDPMDHLDSYKNLMTLQGYSDEVMCKDFFGALKGPTRSWFRKLPPQPSTRLAT